MSDNLPAIPEHGQFESVLTFTYEGKNYTIKGNRLFDKRGYVAVVSSPGYGGGWSTWCEVSPTDARVALTVLVNGTAHITIDDHGEDRDVVVDKRQGFIDAEWYERGSMHGDTLIIDWMSPGTQFQITEYDDWESIEYRDGTDWNLA
jgi:hypothetical protein